MREFLDVLRWQSAEGQRGGFHRIQSHNRSLASGQIIVKLRNEAGEVTNVLYVTRDINDQKISELESREELRELLRRQRKRIWQRQIS